MRAWSWKSSVVFAQWRQRNVPKSLIAHCNWLVLIKIPGEEGGYVLSPIRGNSAQKGAFLRPQVYEKVGKSFTSVVNGTKRANRCILWPWKSPKNVLVLWFIQSSELDIRKRWHLFNRRYTKEVLFLSKKHIKGSRIGPRGGASLSKMFGVSLPVNLSLS